MPKDVVVIFDCDPHRREGLATLLGREGYIVVAHGEIHRLKQNIKEFEICGLIVEYLPCSPELLDLVGQFKKEFPELYIMVLSSEDVSGGEYTQILAAGVNDFFSDSISKEKIFFHLQRGLRYRKTLIQKKREKNRIEMGERLLAGDDLKRRSWINENHNLKPSGQEIK